jgi:hypothetical protein
MYYIVKAYEYDELLQTENQYEGGQMDQMTLQKYGCKLVGLVPCSDSFGVDLIIEKIVASAKPAPASDSL